MLIQERLQLILKMHNLTPSAFADQIGVQRSNVSHALSGRNKPSLDFLEKIINTYPRVNAHWLITGEVSKNGSVQEVGNELLQVEEKVAEKQSIAVTSSAKDLVKIVEFYSDETFKEYYPS